MKNMPKLIVVLILLLAGGKLSAQVWKWGKGSINPSRAIESWPIAVDPDGNTYESGMVFNVTSAGPSTVYWGTHSVPVPTNYCVVIVSADTNGGQRWLKKTEGASAFMINLVSDACGYIYLYGFYNTGTLTIGTVSVTNSFSGAEMYFLAKLDKNGNTVWIKNVGRQSNILSYAYSGGLCINKFSDELYVSGLFNRSTTNIAGTTLVNSSADTIQPDVFVAKYNTAGVPQWARSFGGDSCEDVRDMAAAHNGDVYIGGYYNSESVVVAADTLVAPLRHVKPYLYVAKLDRYGNERWARSSPGFYIDQIHDMTTDNWNNVYMVGSYKDTFSFGTVTLPYLPLPHTESFLIKFDSGGTAKWARTLGGTAPYRINAYGVSADNNGNIWTSGGANTGSVSTPEPMYIARYDTAGTFFDSTSKNSGGDDENAIAVDNRGYLYVGGDYVYTPFIVGPDTLTLLAGSGESIFIAKYKYPFISMPLDTLSPESICQGSTTVLTGIFPCGRWYSDNPAVATVDTFTGLVTGVSPGVTTITYQGGSIGYETVHITVMPIPASIAGPANICYMVPTHYLDATPGGMWSVAPSSIATVSSTGDVVATAAGTAALTYMLASGCFVSRVISVFDALPSMSGADSACLGAPVSYSNPVAGGTWSSSNMVVGTIAVSGVLTTLSPGVTVINYSLGGSCASLKVVTINPLPSAISGPDSVCIGDTILLTDTLDGGLWSTSSASVATISGDGVVTGVSGGSVVVSYISPGGCGVADTIVVQACPLGVFPVEPGKISVFPNPVSDQLTIIATGMIKNLELQNSLGITVYRASVMAKSVTLHLDHLPPGIYVLIPDTGQRIKVSKY